MGRGQGSDTAQCSRRVIGLTLAPLTDALPRRVCQMQVLRAGPIIAQIPEGRLLVKVKRLMALLRQRAGPAIRLIRDGRHLAYLHRLMAQAPLPGRLIRLQEVLLVLPFQLHPRQTQGRRHLTQRILAEEHHLPILPADRKLALRSRPQEVVGQVGAHIRGLRKVRGQLLTQVEVSPAEVVRLEVSVEAVVLLAVV